MDLWGASGSIFVKFLEAVPAGLGAVVSLKFLPTHMSRFEKSFTVCCSYAIGTYFGRGFAAYIGASNDRVIDMIVFGFSIFGLSFIGTVMSEMKPLVRALTHKWVGVTPLLPGKAETEGEDK